MIPGHVLQNGARVRAIATQADVIVLQGYVNRYQHIYEEMMPELSGDRVQVLDGGTINWLHKQRRRGIASRAGWGGCQYADLGVCGVNAEPRAVGLISVGTRAHRANT